MLRLGVLVDRRGRKTRAAGAAPVVSGCSGPRCINVVCSAAAADSRKREAMISRFIEVD
jgi:hypothetical protein